MSAELDEARWSAVWEVSDASGRSVAASPSEATARASGQMLQLEWVKRTNEQQAKRKLFYLLRAALLRVMCGGGAYTPPHPNS